MPSFCSLPAHGKVVSWVQNHRRRAAYLFGSVFPTVWLSAESCGQVSGSITYGWTGARTTAEQRWEKKKGTTSGSLSIDRHMASERPLHDVSAIVVGEYRCIFGTSRQCLHRIQTRSCSRKS